MPFSRSAARSAGALIVLLGAWGGIAPFVGPLFGYRMDTLGAWVWSTPRAELSVGPGVLAVLGGLLLLAARSRALERFGGLAAGAAGAWLVVGVSLFPIWSGSSPLAPIPPGNLGGLGPHALNALQGIGFYYGTGALILALAAYAVGILSLLSLASTRWEAAERALDVRGQRAPAIPSASPPSRPSVPATAPPAPSQPVFPPDEVPTAPLR